MAHTLNNIIFMITLTFLVIFNTSTIFANDNLNSYDYIKLEIENNIDFEVEKGENFDIKKFEVISYFLPQTYNKTQYLNNFETNYNNYNIINESNTLHLEYIYETEDLKSKNTLENIFLVQSTINRPKIKKIESFPIENINTENLKYTKLSGLIDSNTKIKEQASKLAKGETDLFIVASKIAKWIEEDIEYDLSTVLENPNQKSTEVFESKTGVCREITHLYISMLRSLGIPARVVTGYAYTNSEELINFIGSNWGGHAWAEVLIGDTWVPFDLTYNQYGFVDASHIILDRSVELRTNSVQINASGFDFKLVPNSLKTNNEFKVIEKIKNIEDFGFDISLSGPTELSFDSYGYIEVNVENKKDYYQILFLKIAKPKEIELISNNEKMLILKPNEEKKVFFNYKIPQLEKGYIYTFPFSIYNNEKTFSFESKSKESFKYLSENELPTDNNDEKEFSNLPINANCIFKLDLPQNNINCTLINTNNFEMKNINLCITNNCQETNLLIGEEKSILIETNNFQENITIITENSKDISNLKLSKPKLEIDSKLTENNLKLQIEIQNYTISQATKITVNNKEISTNDEKFTEINITLNKGLNEIKIELIVNNKTYEEQTLEYNVDEISSKSSNNNSPDNNNSNNDIQNNQTANIFQKIINWFKNLFNSFF